MSKDWVYTSSTNSRCRILKAVKPLQSFCSKCYPANKTSQSVDTETSSVQFLYIEQWRPAFLVWVSLGKKREREREREREVLDSLCPPSLLSDDDERLITSQLPPAKHPIVASRLRSGFGWCTAFNPWLRYWAHCVGTRPQPSTHQAQAGRLDRDVMAHQVQLAVCSPQPSVLADQRVARGLIRSGNWWCCFYSNYLCPTYPHVCCSLPACIHRTKYFHNWNISPP